MVFHVLLDTTVLLALAPTTPALLVITVPMPHQPIMLVPLASILVPMRRAVRAVLVAITILTLCKLAVRPAVPQAITVLLTPRHPLLAPRVTFVLICRQLIMRVLRASTLSPSKARVYPAA